MEITILYMRKIFIILFIIILLSIPFALICIIQRPMCGFIQNSYRESVVTRTGYEEFSYETFCVNSQKNRNKICFLFRTGNKALRWMWALCCAQKMQN